MYWQEDNAPEKTAGPDAVVDLVYKIRCRCLPVDHAHALSEALLEHLPWLKGTPGAGMHPISIQEAGNGWMRPEGEDELIHLSRRTRLTLRVPQAHIESANRLSGKTLQVAGYELDVLDAETRPLLSLETLFSRYNVLEKDMDEEAFMHAVVEELAEIGIRPRKMLAGKGRKMRNGEARLQTLSLMIADLTHEESLQIQQRGIGHYQHLGCGVFIPQKGIAEVHEIQE
ncbi:type I-MYXAN CRISPR-associated protein Cas6/Cmx6 [Sulfuriflexus sp.]|uniref:type I-MYXAN CRISPR-associated protein Cas6/Cmx6 n=1 Tax=Sulfuriflexus sp. TaxID=2015443 RepID=UPI0028CDD2E6|nr:type I-MYXAN CRISPR-associated protein Cas6/Cmx6 [Sulfuriflexus sp.]MDT8404004.1 type I-MYXAN CRISPR-associated protein Cas6/Cmx6 [Sulfuriflexus sp.]